MKDALRLVGVLSAIPPVAVAVALVPPLRRYGFRLGVEDTLGWLFHTDMPPAVDPLEAEWGYQFEETDDLP